MESIQVKMRDIKLTPTLVYEAMGYGKVLPEENIQNLTKDFIKKAIEITKPSYFYKRFPCSILIENNSLENIENSIYNVKIGTNSDKNNLFDTGRTITMLLDHSKEIFVFTATVGKEFQNWLNEEKLKNNMLRVFMIDSLGSVIVEAVGDYMELQLEKELRYEQAQGKPLFKHTNRFSPGYCGWNIIEQFKLFSLLPEKVCDITLHDSALMTPEKSISGFIGLGENVITKRYGCAICNNKNCYLRKQTNREQIKKKKEHKSIAI